MRHEAGQAINPAVPPTREVALLSGPYGNYGYKVDLDRCRTAADLLGWIMHLSEKTWIKPRHIAELIQRVEQQNGVKVNRAA